MKCESCNIVHDGTYGSGRFCCSKCARSFSTKEKRKEINEKVSNTLKGRQVLSDEQIKEFQRVGREASKKARIKKFENYIENWTKISYKSRRKVLFTEQGGSCIICKNNTWNGKDILLEVDHIDGNRYNNEKSNLRLICPNCHSQTDTYKVKNFTNKISDDQIENALKESNFSIRKALEKLNIAYGGGNWYRVKYVLTKLKF